jgi:hypothetical protein
MPYRGGRRWFSLAAYTMFVGVGIASMVSPIPTFTSTVSMVITIAWSSVLTLGGLLGAIGIVKRMPSLEYAALPLQFVAVAAFGILLLVRTFFGVTSSVWGTLVVGMLMLALTFKLLARWFEIGWIVRSNDSRRQGGKK